MISKDIIQRLQQGNWCVEYKTEQEVNLILEACDEAEIAWVDGDKATEWKPFGLYPSHITFYKHHHGITYSFDLSDDEKEMQNITDWFFNAIKKNNDNGKLTPQNAKQEHLVQILLAMSQNIPIEVNISGEWELSTILFPTMNYEYRIKPTPTPLPISREAWSFINKTWQYAAMDECGAICLYERKPTKGVRGWDTDFSVSDCPLNINTDGINWETSLTERPEGV